MKEKLDTTILQSKTCTVMNDVIKSFADLIGKKKAKTKVEHELLSQAHYINKMHRIATTKVFGGAIAKRLKESSNDVRQ
tara:strand:+ start:2844 stop:3080 length:237 start_codon:yes stop_codon:yes gene_type:complete